MTYSWCMENGGKDTSPDYNAPKICTLGNRGYEEDCVNNDKYFVVSKNLTESVGSDILVKYKTSPTQNISCEYSKDDLDFEIKNERAEYIMSLENNFLILDSGTAPPPRGLIVYDLLKKKNVYNSSYSNPITIKNNKISYWTETSEKVTAENCSDLKEHESYGLGSAIETYITLDLNSLKTTDSGQHRCSPRQ